MSSYAPLFTNPYWQKWKPDAVVFDTTRSFGTPSYHVQRMFGWNRPDTALPVTLPPQQGTPTLFASAGTTKSGDLIVKVVNRGSQSATLDSSSMAWRRVYARGQRIEMSAASPTDENTFDQPTKVAPKVTPLPAFINGGSQAFPPCSVTVLRWSRK